MAKHEISFKVGKDESPIIMKIAERAFRMLQDIDVTDVTKIDLMMDIAAVHANGCPLRLNAMLNADDFNFSHDVFGIRRHLDRETGKLGDHFLPRFVRPEKASAAA